MNYMVLVQTLIYISCACSTIAAYYVLQNDNIDSLYEVLIPYYVWMIYYAIISPLYTLYDDTIYMNDKLNTSMTHLIFSKYMIKVLFSFVKRIFMVSIIPLTIYFIIDYKIDNEYANDNIKIYLILIQIYIWITFLFNIFRSFICIYYRDGEMHYGIALKKSSDKDQQRLNDISSIYILKIHSSGISINNINYTYLFDPVYVGYGISISMIQDVFKNPEYIEFVDVMNDVIHIMNIALIVYCVLNFIHLVIILCIFNDYNLGMLSIGGYFFMVSVRCMYSLLSLHFYKGMFKYLNQRDADKDSDSAFVFYVFSIIMYAICFIIGLFFFRQYILSKAKRDIGLPV